MDDTNTYIEMVKAPTQHDYEFTSDWFSRHEPLWKSLIAELRPRKILEIGAFEGRCTTYLTETCGAWHNTEIFCVDMWDDKLQYSDLQMEAMEDVKARFDKNIRIAKSKTQYDVTVYPLVADSVLGLGQIASQNIRDFDLVYIDGSHIASTVFFDAAMAFQLARVGAAIIFDDYREDAYMPWIYPKIAIDAFAKVHENKIKHVQFFDDGKEISLDKQYQRYFWKISQ